MCNIKVIANSMIDILHILFLYSQQKLNYLQNSHLFLHSIGANGVLMYFLIENFLYVLLLRFISLGIDNFCKLACLGLKTERFYKTREAGRSLSPSF